MFNIFTNICSVEAINTIVKQNNSHEESKKTRTPVINVFERRKYRILRENVVTESQTEKQIKLSRIIKPRLPKIKFRIKSPEKYLPKAPMQDIEGPLVTKSRPILHNMPNMPHDGPTMKPYIEEAMNTKTQKYEVILAPANNYYAKIQCC